MEQLKDGFKTECANWEIEKAALLKRAEHAEAALKPVAEELIGMKHQVNAMTSVIFGKYLVYIAWLTISKTSGLTVNS